MLLHATSSGPIIGQHEQSGDGVRSPPAVPGDLRGKADLAIERAEHRLQVWNDGLDLDDKKRAACRVKGKDVDRPTLAVLVECHLGRVLPALVA